MLVWAVKVDLLGSMLVKAVKVNMLGNMLVQAVKVNPLGNVLVQAVKVNSLGKWKTALQMAALSALLLLHKAHNVLGREEHVTEALHWAARGSLFVLWAGAFLAVNSSP